jgi:hypothetical protein
MADQAGSIMTFLPSIAGKAVANLAPKPSAPAQPGTSATKNPDVPAR